MARDRQQPLPFPGIDPPPSRAEWLALLETYDAACVRAGLQWKRGQITEDEMWAQLALHARLLGVAQRALAEMAEAA